MYPCLYFAIGFAIAVIFCSLSNRADDRDCGDWRNPMTPAIGVLLFLCWPIAAPIILLLCIFSRIG